MTSVRLTLVGSLLIALACNRGRDTTTPQSNAASEPSSDVAATPTACEGSGGPSKDALQHLGRGQGDSFIEILDVVVKKDLVYSCTGTQGLTIWRATDPANPQLLVEGIGPKKISHPRYPRCQRVAVDPERALAVITNRGDEIQPSPFLAMYDVRDPSAPKSVATWTGEESIESATFVDGYVVAATHTTGIGVFEPKGTKLRRVGSFSDSKSDAWHVTYANGFVWAAEGNSGLRVYVLEKNTPKLVSTLKLPGSAKDVVVAEDFATAYLATSDGLAVVDVRDPKSPRLVSHTETPGTALAVAIGQQNHVFVADWGAVHGYDVGDPDRPKLSVSQVVPTEGDFSRVLALDATSDGRVFAGEWQGLHAFDHDPAARAPDIVIEDSPFRLGRVEPGHTVEQRVWVRNRGNAPLDVRNVFSHTAMSMEPSCFSVPEGKSTQVKLGWTPTYGGALDSVVAFMSNDPDEPEARVRVTANLEGIGIGDSAPPFSAVDLGGEVWDNQRVRGKVTVLAYFATF